MKCIIIICILPAAQHIRRGKVSAVVKVKNLSCIVKVSLPTVTSVVGERGHPPLRPSSSSELWEHGGRAERAGLLQQQRPWKSARAGLRDAAEKERDKLCDITTAGFFTRLKSPMLPLTINYRSAEENNSLP